MLCLTLKGNCLFAPSLYVHTLHVISFPFSSFYPSLSLAPCLFSSLGDTQYFSGRSGSWLAQGEAIKTTPDWNRHREQQCKLK